MEQTPITQRLTGRLFFSVAGVWARRCCGAGSGWHLARGITVIDPSPSAELIAFAGHAGFCPQQPALRQTAQTIVLAVKPQKSSMLAETLASIAAGDTLLISIMRARPSPISENYAGHQCFCALHAKLAGRRRARRDRGFCGQGCTAAHLRHALRLLSCTGQFEWLDREEWIDAATGLSGSGPAYLFYMTDCLAQAGIAAGLPAAIASDWPVRPSPAPANCFA